MSKIIGLNGAPPPAEDGTRPEVIALLRDALAKAERGEVIACALVLVDPRQSIFTQARNPAGARHALVAGAHYILTDLASESRDSGI